METIQHFIFWLRDVVTAAVFITIILACVFHDFRARFDFLFPVSKPANKPQRGRVLKPSPAEVLAARKRIALAKGV